MTHDYGITRRQIIKEYLILNGDNTKVNGLSLDDCLKVFDYFFKRYKQRFGKDHPRLSSTTIYGILVEIDGIISESNDGFMMLPSDLETYIGEDGYAGIIDVYFHQRFDNCNYSIAHFMSGGIRAICYYELAYFEE